MSEKFKIQYLGARGWWDLKSSTNDGPYVPDLFDTKAAAVEEAETLASWMVDPEEFRVVPANQPEDWSPYT